jgi:hypothetical protein
MWCYGPSAGLTIDLAPWAKARLAHQAHRRAATVGASDHYGAPNGLRLSGDGGEAAGVRCSDVLGPLGELTPEPFSQELFEQ